MWWEKGCQCTSTSRSRQVIKMLPLDMKSNLKMLKKDALLVWACFKIELHTDQILTLKNVFVCLCQCHLGCPWVSPPSVPTCTSRLPPWAMLSATPPQAYIIQSPPVTTQTSRPPMAWWQVSRDGAGEEEFVKNKKANHELSWSIKSINVFCMY